jgi:osmoprotectant transport system permease protein
VTGQVLAASGGAHAPGAPLFAGVRDDLFSWEWVSEHTEEIWEATVQHLQLTTIALVIGFVLSAVLAVIALRFRWTYAPITWVSGVLYSIPSLALFAFLVPITGLTTTTAEIGLVSYTLLILVRNMVAGVDGVPTHVKEAADGMGYTGGRRFFSVDLRLATPTIIAGLRIATVTTVGLVTITALIGQGGYGSLIDDGLSRNFPTPTVVGAVLSVAMAIVLDLALVGVEWAVTPWSHRGAKAR